MEIVPKSIGKLPKGRRLSGWRDPRGGNKTKQVRKGKYLKIRVYKRKAHAFHPKWNAKSSKGA